MLEARALVSRPNVARRQFGTHRPSATDPKTSAHHRIEEGLPARAGCAQSSPGLRLLEGVVDGDREAGVRLFGKTLHRLFHAVEEEGVRLFLAPVPVWSGYQFFGLRDGERGEEIGKDWTERAAQPDVEEVREVGVADVVVVGRVS